MNIAKETEKIKSHWEHPERHAVPDPDLELAVATLRRSKKEIDCLNIDFNVFLQSLLSVKEIVRWLDNPETKLSFWHVCARLQQDPSTLRAEILKPIHSSLLAILLNTPNVRCPCCGRKG